MRRGAPRGRSNNRPMQQRPLNPRQSSAPMMTGHLQGLKDIDMELELLKRKREIIEQQQNILSNNYRQRNDYEQPQFSQSRDNRYDNYTSLYDNPRESHSYSGNAPNRKRAHIPVWENELPTKRFSAPSRGVKKAFGSRLGPQPNNPRPDFHRTASKPFKPNLPQRKREFNTSKVAKPTAAAPPSKLANYQPAERKKLVAETLASSGATVRAPPGGSDSWILRADREPSRQMNGRLELALGSVMKDLKVEHPESEELFRQPVSVRAMKQAVRERIRTAMIGKVVTTSDDIKANYYDMFPLNADNHVVMKGLEAQKGTDFITIKADDPETYFKKNMHRLMSMKLDEMTTKLEQLYSGNNPGFTPRKKNRYQGKAKTAYKHNADGSKADNVQPKAANQSETAADQSTGELQTTTDDGQLQTNEVKPKLDEANSKPDEAQSKPDEAQANPDEAQEAQSNPDEAQSKPDEAQSKPDEAECIAEETPEIIEVQAKPDETQSKTVASQAKPKAAAQKVVSVKEAFKAFTPPPEIVNTDQYKAFDKLMTYKIIHLLKKFSPAVLKIMDIDQMYRKTKGTILSETRKKLLGNADGGEQHTPQDAAQQGATDKPEKRFLQPLQYYVKILGKPSLPKRKAMESFFSEFNPQSVKKHRTIHNLLFVGFVEKEGFDKILAANGTVIGRFTLDIKISERNYDKKNQSNATADSSAVTIEGDTSTASIDESGSEVIGADLDDQITDLLTSIRKSEQDSSSDDVVLIEPKAGDQTDVKIENGDQSEVNNESIKNDQNDEDVIEIKDVKQADDEVIPGENVDFEMTDAVAPLKTEVKGTPTRASARLSTPSGIKTRRMSRLAE